MLLARTHSEGAVKSMAKEAGRPLIIVESPTKARTISRFMKAKYDVKASLGHIRDLPKSRLGVDVANGFAPQYINIRGKGPVIKELKDAAKRASEVYLATDPDREGEAISWHLCNILEIEPEKARRVSFHEITERAVKEAFSEPVPINAHLVDSYQARRVLDRLVGYSLSPLLWRKVRPGLSAGRVQSAALHLIVSREQEIAGFQHVEYWTLDAELQGAEGNVKARYIGENGKKQELSSEAQVNRIMEDLDNKEFRVSSIAPKTRKKSPPYPFITSTLQQEAARKLGFPVRRTMSLAQTLYEGVELGPHGYTGLITYMRTDSVRVSQSATGEARTYIAQTYGSEYLGRPRQPRRKPGEQGAHEAIRPTSVMRQPEELKQYLKPELYKLYKLIWDRFVASQMAPAVYDTVSVEIDAGGHTFRATGSRLQFAGFERLYQESLDEPVEDDREIIPLSQGEVLALLGLDKAQHFTEPPPRYTEASLVKALEENGIGRPSTYAPIIATLSERDYVKRETRRLVPTELGVTVDKLMQENFPSIVDLKFTAGMEKKLDSVEEGKEEWTSLIREFWTPFKSQIDKAEKEINRLEIEDEPAGLDCDKCGKPMVIKRGRYGKFIACSGYPECKNTMPFHERIGVLCPKCKGDIVVRRTRKGRLFYGCSNYPACDLTSWKRPLPGATCPVCGWFLVEAGGKGKGIKCANPDCNYAKPLEN